MTDKKNQPAAKTRISWSWLRMALSLREKVKLGDKQVIFIWAVVVGALGALTALVFEMGVELVQDVLTGRTSYKQIQVFQEMASQDWAWCIFVPAAGGLLAGLTLLFTHRFVPAKATEYMEAVALGNGYVPPKPSLLRSLSAVFSVGSGASIGREGPLVQAAAVVGSAKAALASSQAQIPAIQVQIANLENAVSVLAGRAPGRIRRSGSTRDIAYNVKVPAGIPAYILSRRPDVRQSEYQLRAANAEVGVAIANYFPTISLTAAGGLASADLRHVQGRRGGWGFGTNLTGPLFQAGKLTASEKAAKAEFLAASNDYEQTVLNALAEVSSTLIQRAKLRNITSIQSEAVEAYQTAVKLSFERYRTGLSNYIEVLYAQQNLYPAQIQLSQYYYQHASTLVSLYTALGGGWNMSHKAIMDGPSKR